jgi:hypothetical protein
MQAPWCFVYAPVMAKRATASRWIGSLVAAGLALVACQRVPPAVPARAAAPVPAETRDRFAGALIPLAPEPRGPLIVEGQHVVERLSLASPRNADTARRVAIDVYRPSTGAPRPVLLLLPSAGGSYWIERSFARYFADRGYAAILLRREKLRPGEKLIEAVDDLLRQSVIDGARVLDWVATRPDLDPQRVGLFGISMGGIKGALLAPLEPRIGAAVLGLAGGDLPVILTQTTEPGIAAERAAWLARSGLDLAGAERELRRVLEHDPLDHAVHADPRRYLLILARFDRAVPVANGWQLWAALGKPATIVLPTGHYTAVLAIPWLKPAILEFFNSALAPAPPVPAPEA